MLITTRLTYVYIRCAERYAFDDAAALRCCYALVIDRRRRCCAAMPVLMAPMSARDYASRVARVRGAAAADSKMRPARRGAVTIAIECYALRGARREYAVFTARARYYERYVTRHGGADYYYARRC